MKSDSSGVMTLETAKQSIRHRSPAYPAFALSAAVDKARVIYEAHKRSSVTVDSLKETLGYEPATSHAMRAISALIQFGMLEVDGSGDERRLKLSDLCLNILLRGGNDPERLEQIRKAALLPTVYRQIAENWNEELPEDEPIMNYLLFTKNFNPEVVEHVIRDLRATWKYAGMSARVVPANRETVGYPDREKPKLEIIAPVPDPTPVAQVAAIEASRAEEVSRTLTMPLARGREALLQLPSDLTGPEVDLLVRYLAVVRETMS